MSKASPAKKAASTALVLIIFSVLGRALYLNAEALGAYEWNLKYHFLFVSFVPLALNYLIAAYVWIWVLKMLGHRIGFSQSFRITYLSASGKYLPGRIWTYVGRIYLAARAGIPQRLTLVSMALMFVTYNGIAILFFLCTLLLWENRPIALITVLIPLSSLLLLFVFHPKALSKALSFSLRLFRKQEVKLEVRYRSILSLLGLLILDRMIFASFAYLFINSFMTLDPIAAIKFSGIFSVAVLLGMIVFIVPAGLGVREGVQTYLLSMFLPISAAVLIPLTLRVCMTLGELICFAAALRIKRARADALQPTPGERRPATCGQAAPVDNCTAMSQPTRSTKR